MKTKRFCLMFMVIIMLFNVFSIELVHGRAEVLEGNQKPIFSDVKKMTGFIKT